MFSFSLLTVMKFSVLLPAQKIKDLWVVPKILWFPVRIIPYVKRSFQKNIICIRSILFFSVHEAYVWKYKFLIINLKLKFLIIKLKVVELIKLMSHPIGLILLIN